jgi:hypothetical protein
MARCPFAEWKPIGTSASGAAHFDGGPFRIVHHTTEGSSAAGALSTFARNRDAPHFTVDAKTIWQHVDTGRASRALRHRGTPTNSHSAIQIEVVGFADKTNRLNKKGQPNEATLHNVARLCRWLEATHGIPQTWPNGPPALKAQGFRKNRSIPTWLKKGGHFGHVDVPGNIHYDPGYTEADLHIITPDYVYPRKAAA